MFNNNINKPAITVFFATDISKNYFLPMAKTIFAGTVFSAEKNGFYRSLAKTCQPWCVRSFLFVNKQYLVVPKCPDTSAPS